MVATVPVTVRVGSVYEAVYTVAAMLSRSFGAAGGLVLGNLTRQEFTLWQEWQAMLGVPGPDPRSAGVGGWTLDVHQAYDPAGQ